MSTEQGLPSANQDEPAESIKVGDISNAAGVAIGAGATSIVAQIVQGLGDISTDYQFAVRDFLHSYLGTPEHPAPFGGRDKELKQLDDWLADANAPHYALVTAPAGRGKSALLAQWVNRVQERQAAHVVFFPISLRFETSTAQVAYAAMAALLSRLIDNKPLTRATSAEEYRGTFRALLEHKPTDGRPLLVVIDALDESEGWDAAKIPFPPPNVPEASHLRVVVSARLVAGDVDGTNWRRRLNWTGGNTRQMNLAVLGLDEFRDVLRKMGNPLDGLASDFDIVKRLHELTEGDPLLVRWYVETLREESPDTVRLRVNDLLKISPGLGQFVDFYFAQLEALSSVSSQARDSMIQALSVAHGPLSSEDLFHLAPGELANPEAAAKQLQRFVIGDGNKQGYVFSHPRLRQYFLEEKLPKGIVQEWQKRFLRYGRATLEGVQSGHLALEDTSSYIVRYYAVHLDEAKAPNGDLYALMCEGWLRAHECHDGTPDGFLADCDFVRKHAEKEGGAAVGQMAREALCRASVASLGANINMDLLVACVRTGELSIALGLALAHVKPDLYEQAQCLAALSQFLPAEQRASVLAEALQTARLIQDEGGRVSALRAVAQQLLVEQPTLLAEALQAVRSIEDEGRRADVLSALAQQLPVEQQASVLAEALQAARSIKSEGRRASALKVVARQMSAEQPALLAEALQAARSIKSKGRRVDVLSAVVQRLPAEQHMSVLAEALQVARSIQDEGLRASTLRVVARQMSAEQHASILAEALPSTRLIQDRGRRVSALRAVAQQMSAEQHVSILAEALQSNRLIQDGGRRASALRAVAERLSAEQQGGVLAEALQAARALQDERSRASALSEVAERLPAEQPVLLAEALQVARGIQDERSRASALRAVVARLSAEQQGGVLAEALQVARGIQDERSRASALSEVAERLSAEQQGGVLAEALQAARAIQNEGSRASALSEVAERLSAEQQGGVLAEALQAACAIQDERSRASALSEVAERLPAEQSQLHRLVWQTVLGLANELGATQTLANLIPHWSAISTLEGKPEQDILSETLRVFARAGRPQCLNALEVLSPIIGRLGGESALQTLAQSIMDTAKWWR